MLKEFYFGCECGGSAVLRIHDLVDEANKFDIEIIANNKFVCEKCGKEYYSGDIEEFIASEEDMC